MSRHPDFLPRIPDKLSVDTFASMSHRGMMVCAQTRIDTLFEAANPDYLVSFMGGAMEVSDVLLAGQEANGFYLRKGCVARSEIVAGTNLRLYVASKVPHADGVIKPNETISWLTYSPDFISGEVLGDGKMSSPELNTYIARTLLPSLVYGTILHAKTKPKEMIL